MKKSDATNDTPKTAGGANGEFPITETATNQKSKGGRPKDPNAKVFVGARIPADLVEYVKKWETEAGAQGFGEALEACLRDARKFVSRPGFERSRDAQGRWLPD